MKKNLTLILSIVAAALVAGACNNKNTSKDVAAEDGETATVASAGAVVYFNLDRVINEYDMANELRSAVESKVQSLSDEVTRRGNKLQKDVNDFQDKVNKGLMTSSVAQIQGEKLQKQQDEFNSFANSKQQEAAEEQQVMMNQIGDAINTFVQKYNAEKKYALIIATQGDVLSQPVVAGDSSLDITEDLLKRLNEEYVKEKAKK